MRYAFISDIHGNYVALKAVLEHIEKSHIDQIFVLGDLCFRGPEPKKCLDLIRSLPVEVIKGNADEWVLRGVKRGEVPDEAFKIMNIERDWTVSKLEPSDLCYLESLSHSFKAKANDITIHMFHATPNSLFENVMPNADNDVLYHKLMTGDAQIFVYGHIHTPYIRYIHGKTVINTGSVGLPFDGLKKASYAVIEIDDRGNVRTSIERVNFDTKQVIDQYYELNYPNADMMAKMLQG